MLDAMPPVMRFVRRHMRQHRSKGLSVSQFRALALLRSTKAANLSSVADFLCASLPTASRVVNGLVKKGFIHRREASDDRRQLELVITARGIAIMETAQRETRARLAEELESIPASERTTIAAAMRALQELFLPTMQNADAGAEKCATNKRARPTAVSRS